MNASRLHIYRHRAPGDGDHRARSTNFVSKCEIRGEQVVDPAGSLRENPRLVAGRDELLRGLRRPMPDHDRATRRTCTDACEDAFCRMRGAGCRVTGMGGHVSGRARQVSVHAYRVGRHAGKVRGPLVQVSGPLVQVIVPDVTQSRPTQSLESAHGSSVRGGGSFNQQTTRTELWRAPTQGRFRHCGARKGGPLRRSTAPQPEPIDALHLLQSGFVKFALQRAHHPGVVR